MIGFLYILIVIGLVALPLHVYLGLRELGADGSVPWFVWVLGGVGLIVGLLGAILPIKGASRFLERMEF